MRLSLLVRERHHPLFHLRRVSAFQKLTRLPGPAGCYPISHDLSSGIRQLFQKSILRAFGGRRARNASARISSRSSRWRDSVVSLTPRQHRSVWISVPSHCCRERSNDVRAGRRQCGAHSAHTRSGRTVRSEANASRSLRSGRISDLLQRRAFWSDRFHSTGR
jgi:hypothetical protein